MTIIIAGGAGFLGSALAGAWRQDGREVLVLTRRPRGEHQIGWSPGSGADGEWVAAVQNADAVVNLAGESIAGGRWTAARKAAIRDSRLRATRALAGAILNSPSRKPVFVSASGVGVYGPRGDEAVTEDTPPGFDFLASVCREWEAEALAAAASARVVLLRTGLVLSNDGGALPRMALPFRFFGGGPSGSGRQYMPWIHVDDWVAMTRWAVSTPSVSGPLNVVAPNPVTNAEFARELGRALRRPAFLPAPAFALRLALGEMADALLLAGQRALPAKALALGFSFRYAALQDALRAIYGQT
jgi:uncharacterized protein (TIGR01777 family)